jgi:large subunit ribosomal protein L29
VTQPGFARLKQVSQSDRDVFIHLILQPMANNQLAGLTEMTDAELTAELEGSETLYQKMKFEHAVKGLQNPMELRNVRRNIARINTELRKREVAGLSAEELAMRSKIRARRRKQ